MHGLPGFLRSGDRMAPLIAAHDWSQSSVGPIDAWPSNLQMAVGMILRFPLPMALLWGEDGTLIYNEHYVEIAGQYHPTILGLPVKKAWPEAKEFNGHVLQTCLAGEPLTFSRQELTLFRGGAAETAFFDLNYAPVPGPDGEPTGAIATVIEVTEAVAMENSLIAETQTLETLNQVGAALAAELKPKYFGTG